MTAKRKLKLVIDCCMTAALPVLMAYSLVGEAAHEWVGSAMFVMLIAHHVLNGSWHKNLARGRWTGLRIFGTGLGVLLLIDMAFLMISGVILSKSVFTFLPFVGGTAFARTAHLLASYWGFVLMSLHLGMHWNVLTGIIKKRVHSQKVSAVCTTLFRIIAALIPAYGIYAFYTRQIGSYLLLRNRLVFYDFSEPLVFFILDYLAIMGFFVCIGYHVTRVHLPNSEHKCSYYPARGRVVKSRWSIIRCSR